MLLLLLSSQLGWAQVTKTLPGDYASFAAAFTDLNTNGVPAGGVTINVAAGYAETLAAPLLLTATGTAANPVVFQKSGSGANPKITAGVGTTTGLDAIIGLSGADYVTFDGLELAENAANTTPTQQMEFGFALFRPSPTDGCQFNVIRNCVVTLNKANTGTFGIYGAATTAAATTSVAATSPAGANSNNRIYGNTVSNAVSGMYLTGNSSTAAANFDQNNEIGVTAGNTVTNFGGAATSGWGIGVNVQNGAKIANNIVNSTGGTAGTSTLRGIYGNSGTSANIDITNNTITLVSGATTSTTSGIDNGIGSTAASNTVNITGNTVNVSSATVTTGTTTGITNSASAATVNVTGNTVTGSLTASTTAALTGISNSGSGTTVNLSGNTVNGCSLPTATTGVFTGVVNSGSGTTVNLNNNIVTNNTAFGTGSMLLVSGGSPTTLNMNGNTVTGNSKTPAAPSASITMQALTAGSAAVTASNNTVSNNTITISGTSSSAGVIYGYYQNSSPTSETLTSNTFSNLTVGGTSTSAAHIVAGIRTFPTATTVHVFTLNTIATLSVTGSGSGAVSGMLFSSGGGTASNYARNKIYDLSAVGASATVNGINISGGGTFPLNNNLIGDLRAPAATSLVAVNGLQIGAATAANVYYNTISLAATSSGATFGTSGLYLSSTTPTVDVRNNIVVNKSTAAGTGGFTAALRRTSAAFTGYATNSNNNAYYAGTPSATQVLYYDGTTGYPTLAAFKTAVTPRESNSVTEDVSFLSTTGSAATFLHINPAVPTQVEGNATPVASVTVDFDGQTRNATTPDIGADEGTFTPQDLTGPVIVYTPLGNTNSTANRTLTATITDASGIGTGTNAPRLYYRKGTSGAFVFVTPTSVSGNDYTFTFDFAAIGGVTGFDVVQYYVAAQDNAPAQNVSSTPVGASGNNPPGTAFSGTPNQFSIQGVLSGTYYVGTSTSPDPARTYASLTAAVAAYNNNNLGGAVTFLLLDAAYSAATGETFPLVINANADASATNTLTIKPNSGVTAAISGSVATGAAFKLNGADYVTIDGANSAGGTTQNLTIENTSATGSGNAVLWLAAASATDGATFNTVKNSVIRGTSATGTPQFTVFLGGGGVGVASPTTSTPAANSNNTITNNQILKGYYGLFMFGVSATVLDQSNVVSGNQLGLGAGNGFGQEGIRAVYQQNLLLEGNEIQNITNGTTTSNLYGIFLADSRSATLSRNSVHNVSYTGTSTTKVWGIFTSNTAFNTAATPSTTLLANNLVYGLNSTATSSTWNTVGINNGGGYGDKYYFNTVYLSGQLSAATGTAGSAAFANGNPSVTTSATNIDVRNNIFSIIGGTGGSTTTPLYAHYTQATTYSGSLLDNNDLYVTAGSTGLARIGRLNAVDAVDLAAWRTATAQEANSVSVDPLFTQVTGVPYNLKPANLALNSAGATGTGITVDYLNATRSNPPDIGAIEFTPPPFDLAATALVSPTATAGCYGAAEAIVVAVRNQGSSALDFSANNATVTAVVTLPGGGTQTLTAALTSGTLAVGATQNVTLSPTLDMTAAGTYSFAITATVAGDGNTSNDALTPTPVRTVVAPVAGTLSASNATICLSGTTALTLAGSANGSIQLQQSTDNVTFTDIAGATSATFTTPVLTGTTYFRARTTCGTNVATSNVVTVTVNNPQITSTNSPVAICEGGTATLTATAATGTTIRFYDAATGGNLLATAASYTTPVLTASQQYFVEASLPGSTVAGLTSNAASNGTFTQSTLTDYPLGFAVTQAGTLTSVDVYPTAAGTLTIRLYSVAGTQPGGTTTAVAGSDVTITVTAAQVGTKVTVPLNYALTPGDYKLSNFAGGLGRYSTYTGTYPLTSADGILTVKGSYTLFSSTSYSNTTYNSFFNLTFSNVCAAAARTPIQVNVSALPTASLASATDQLCAGTSYQLAGTVGGSATGGTFTSSGSGSFSPNATALNATYSPSAADISAGSVVITLTTTGPAACAPATATTTLTINPAAVATLTAGGATTFCQGGSVTLTAPAVTGSTYQFLLNGSAISGATTNTYSASASGSYSVTVTTAQGCTATSTATVVTVNPLTTATFSYPAATYCQNDTNPT
ncbi:beta strand repeat-containing protein, partial [Hymenobacter persicinus]